MKNLYSYYNNKFKKKVVVLSPGDIYSTEEDIILQTVLGSCISVCLYTDLNQIVGMNHFMLPGKVDYDDFFTSNQGRYGMYAMDLLIGEFVKKGIKKNSLKSKVFGGSNLLHMQSNMENVASMNIKFIVNFLNKENIHIESSHLGGNKPKKILFFSSTKKVLLKEISDNKNGRIVNEELSYRNKIIKNINKSSIIMFD